MWLCEFICFRLFLTGFGKTKKYERLNRKLGETNQYIFKLLKSWPSYFFVVSKMKILSESHLHLRHGPLLGSCLRSQVNIFWKINASLKSYVSLYSDWIAVKCWGMICYLCISTQKCTPIHIEVDLPRNLHIIRSAYDSIKIQTDVGSQWCTDLSKRLTN